MNHRSNGKDDRGCPKCGDKESLVRVRRDFFDRLASRFVSVRRYQCYYCGWEGLMRGTPSSKKKESNQIISR